MILKPKLFIDTGGWIALLNSEDQYHQRARLFYQQLHPTVHRMTTSYVIAETYTWLRYRAGFAPASQFIQIARQATDQGI
jgi:predicted nucleic acid-binding protein